MPTLDKRFALKRGGELWYAALIESRTGGPPTFRISGDGTRDAKGGSEHVTDLSIAAQAVLLMGKRIRFAPGKGKAASSLYLTSKGVTGYELDPDIAAALGVPRSR
jgi:hypothetical protein